jgi:hypothetical protein
METSGQNEINETKNIDIDFSDSEKYPDEYLNQLILLSFAYFDHHIDKEKYQRGLENLTNNFGDTIRPQLIKIQLKYLIDFIDKYSNADAKFIERYLFNLKLKKEYIDLFIKKMFEFNERIETFKNAMIEKITSQRVINFSHSFKVKFIDSQNGKINFVINIVMKYLNDNGEENDLDLELTLNQFYSVYEQFQKIDTLIKTLI